MLRNIIIDVASTPPQRRGIFPQAIILASTSKQKLQSKLNLPRLAVGGQQLACAWIGWTRRVGTVHVKGREGVPERRVVQTIEKFSPELNLELFRNLGNPEVLVQRIVHSPQGGTNDGVPSRVTLSPQRR